MRARSKTNTGAAKELYILPSCTVLKVIPWYCTAHPVLRITQPRLQAWLRGFMDKFHGSVLFSLSHKSQRIFLDKTMSEFNRSHG